ncbi:t-SNARE coiled-coil homology domain-containing protein [Candidatus Magnetomoraceae bacterium gMMP-15]
MKVLFKLFIIISILFFDSLAFYQTIRAEDGFTEKDRNILLQLQIKMELIDKRFEQVDKRFEQVDKRFEQVDKHFEELREDMNKRFEELREDMNKRFEQVDKRFEQMNNRFEDMLNFLYILAGIFSTMVVGVIGFAYWDRRTILYKAREEVRETTQKDREIIKDNQRRIEEHQTQLNTVQLLLRRMALKSSDLKQLLSDMNML